MIKTTRWSPDTCECVIEFDWDSETNGDNRVHTISNVINTCDAHKKHAGDMASHFGDILLENQTKNKSYAKIIETMPEVCRERIQEDGTVVRELKPDKGFVWSFDKDRKLVVNLLGFTDEEKTKANENLQSVSDKVLIK